MHSHKLRYVRQCREARKIKNIFSGECNFSLYCWEYKLYTRLLPSTFTFTKCEALPSCLSQANRGRNIYLLHFSEGGGGVWTIIFTATLIHLFYRAMNRQLSHDNGKALSWNF